MDFMIAIPAIILAGPVFGSRLKHIQSGPVSLFEQKEESGKYHMPGRMNSFISATLPVFLLILSTVIPYCFTHMGETTASLVSFIGAPSVVMMIALVVATYTLGTRQGRSIKEEMGIYTDAVKDIAMILLIIAGSGIFKQIMEDSGVSNELAVGLQQLPTDPLILGWLIAAVIRGCVGSATVAALTAAGVIMPLTMRADVNPSLMVLSLGAGSLMFSHVNDSGFWLFKEYFNLSIKDTLKSWSVMEAIVSVTGLAGVMVLNTIV